MGVYKRMRRMLFLLGLALGFPSKHAFIPKGTFYGHVRPFLLPDQEITLTVGANDHVVTLRGALNAKDKFWFEQSDGKWIVHLGPTIRKAMERARAQLVGFEFKPEENHGIAIVKLPLVGRIRVVLTRLT